MVAIAVIDYGMGNLHSACKGLEQVGGKPYLVTTPTEIAQADAFVLPGVGAFDPAMQHLRERDLVAPIQTAIAQGKPLLGICLGMQILFESSAEGQEAGLALLPGRVQRFTPEPHLTIPHMGWNQLHLSHPSHPLWKNLPRDPFMYFVHSYYVAPQNPQVTAATVTHGQQTVTAAIAHDNLVAVQFHPEKSSLNGLRLLANFVEWVKEGSLAVV